MLQNKPSYSERLAIPGGHVDANETPAVNSKREFAEECVAGAGEDPVKMREVMDLLGPGVQIFVGFADSLLNTGLLCFIGTFHRIICS